MIKISEFLTLCLDQQILLDKLILFKNLHRIWLAITDFPNKVNLTKGASTHNSQKLKVVDRDLGTRLQDVLCGTIILLISVIIKFDILSCFGHTSGHTAHSAHLV